jgi:hypothetical protein
MKTDDDENGDDDDVEEREGGDDVKSNEEAFIIQSEKRKAKQSNKRKPKATKPKTGSKSTKVFTDRTNVDPPPHVPSSVVFEKAQCKRKKIKGEGLIRTPKK